MGTKRRSATSYLKELQALRRIWKGAEEKFDEVLREYYREHPDVGSEGAEPPEEI